MSIRSLIIFIVLINLLLLTKCRLVKEKGAQLPIIPHPVEVTEHDGVFRLQGNTEIIRVSEAQDNNDVPRVVQFMKSCFEPSTGFTFNVRSEEEVQNNAINLIIKPELSENEGYYQLRVMPQRIDIEAAHARGLFYGVQTIRQLLPPQVEERSQVNNVNWEVPLVRIKDKPRFSYRGMHLDVCRHMFPVSFIKKYIDLLALHKMNTFHWHLTEDQGWRIEIKRYPNLTKVGAFRDETIIGHAAHPPFEYDGKRYGGFYTQEEVREIVEYARSRFITVIPEIEMPGHSRAALAAYPELGCTGGPYKVAAKWGIFEDVYCAGNEETFEFLQNVLTEVMELFPSKYIHIGGDECPKERWKDCPKCQSRMRGQGLNNEQELQSYFIKRIEKFVRANGRYIIGWDEILEGGLPPEATVMSWRGIKGGVEAARKGHDVIMTPGTHCYFDHYQANPDQEPLAIGGLTTLRTVYHFEPIPDALNKQESKHVLGAQANLWTEYIETAEHAEYMAYPRACALAEVNWTPHERKHYRDFLIRLDKHKKRLDALNVNYFDKVPPPETQREHVYFLEKGTVALSTEIPGAEIHYTTDGSEPALDSPLYSETLTFHKTIELKAKTFRPEKDESSHTRVVKVEKLEFLEPHDVSDLEPGLGVKLSQQLFQTVKEMEEMEGRSLSSIASVSIPESVPDTAYGLIYTGYIQIPNTDVYRFRLSSDDGSLLSIDGKTIVDNDGMHWFQGKEGQAALRAGLFPIKILYFNAWGGGNIRLEWATDKDFTQVPPAAFFN